MKDVKVFLRICAYYYYQVNKYAIIIIPLTTLLKKGELFIWGSDQQEAIEIIKTSLSNPPTLKLINYLEGSSKVILRVNISINKYRGNLN